MQGLNLFALLLLRVPDVRASCENITDADPACSSYCSGLAGCVQCLAASGCGWCSIVDLISNSDRRGFCTMMTLNGQRRNLTRSCIVSDSDGSQQSTISGNKTIWRENACRLENECETGNDNCDLAIERCVDTESGFECWCRDGYERKGGFCTPACANGCINGICIQPNICQCYFGFVGSTCERACNCYGHSTCPGPGDLDTCLECHNRTKGPHCELCESGRIRKGNSCVSCNEYCFNHSDICLNARTYNLMQSFITAPPDIMAKDLSPVETNNAGTDGNSVSSLVPAVCVNCSDFTKGLQCEYCLPGYFRPPKSPPWMPCTPCDCNGHSIDNVCNPQRGDGCECQNNTMTPRDCKDDDCWMMQCSVCKEKFRGTPLKGHQCYREVAEADQDLCLVPEDCKSSRLLRPMEMSFFVLTPEFSNVDVRIVLDVGQGIVDAFLTARDVFSVRYDSLAGCNVLSWRAIQQSSTTTTGSNKGVFSNGPGNEVEACFPGRDSSWDYVDERDARNRLASYFAYEIPQSLLVLRNVSNRAVIIAPATAFDLKTTRFYLVLRAHGSATAGVRGNLLYNQDQAHFDLFIFFTVFFAAFFLAVAVALVAWKFKARNAERLSVRAQTLELMKLANRPFVNVAVFYEQRGREIVDETGIAHTPWPFCFQHLRKKSVAVATLAVKMPGGVRAPVKLALATALVFTGSSTKNSKTQEEMALGYALGSHSKKNQARRYLTLPLRYRIQPR